jgi:bifunctional ADP-heptose synthase (sugar kinase/adenylyltransferase)
VDLNVDLNVDTRVKIVSSAALPDLAGAMVVSGYFDPLLAWHARRLSGLKQEGRPLVVVIENPALPILPSRARAELVASLAAVDYVVECPEGIAVAVRLEGEDEQQFQQLIARVHDRQRGASK